MSVRAARAARALLIRWGFITGDNSSNQHQLNRYGTRFDINPHCIPDHDTGELQRRIHLKELAAPPPGNLKELAPPNKEHRTLSDKENQKLSSGVQEQRKSPPQLRCIELSDLRDMERLLELHQQAIHAGWIDGSEASRVFFVAAAVRVRQTKSSNPVKVFVVLVRRYLQSHITQAQEDEALRLLRNHVQAASKSRVSNLIGQLAKACSMSNRKLFQSAVSAF